MRAGAAGSAGLHISNIGTHRTQHRNPSDATSEPIGRKTRVPQAGASWCADLPRNVVWPVSPPSAPGRLATMPCGYNAAWDTLPHGIPLPGMRRMGAVHTAAPVVRGGGE